MADMIQPHAAPRATSVLSDGIAAERLVEVFRSSSWTKGPPEPSSAFDRDRSLNLLFEGTTRLDLDQALARGHGSYHAPRPEEVGELLRWAQQVGLVDHDRHPVRPTWFLVRHGVTYIPRGRDARGHRDSFDVRLELPGIGGMSLASLVKREANRRERMRRRNTDSMLQSIRDQLALCEPSTPLPMALRGTDLPPVETVGEFRDNFSGFSDHLPTWRVTHIHFAVVPLPRTGEPVDCKNVDRGPPELADFRI